MKLYFSNNNYNRHILLFPGWTFDYKIFPQFDYNIIYYDKIDFDNYIKITTDFIKKNNLSEIYMLGWSMGNFVINNILPYLKIKIKKIFLISPVEKFNELMLLKTKQLLDKNIKSAMRKFYRNIFIGDKNKYTFFQDNYYNYYINKLNEYEIYTGLEFLKNNYIVPKNFIKQNTEIITAKKDIITPYREVIKLRQMLNNCKIYTIEYTHAPFLYKEVIDEINKG